MSLYVLCVSKKEKSVHTEFNHAKTFQKIRTPARFVSKGRALVSLW